MATSVPRPQRPDLSGVSIVEYDVRGVRPDAVTVAVLARLQLLARRNGCTLELRNASAELLDVVAFMGLGEILKAH
jgi:ABC-type transporter Mla MlaB component